VAVVQDVTERRAAEAGMRASERRYRALAEAGALVLWRADATGAVLEGLGWGALTGQSDEALRGEGWLAVLHPEDRAVAAAALAEAVRLRRPVEVEYRVRLRDGSWRWMSARGAPVFDDTPERAVLEWVGTVHDVHDRRMAEEGLRLAIEAAGLGSWAVDLRTGTATRSGQAVPGRPGLPLAGFSVDEYNSRHVHPDDAARVRAALADLAAGRTERLRVEYRVRSPDGDGWAWVESYGGVAERDPGTGQPTHLAGVARNVSERRRAEERMALLAREVDHRAKNALAVVQALVRLIPRDDPAAFVGAVEDRITALARVHGLLAQSRWEGAALRALFEAELAPFGLPAGRRRQEGPPRIALAGPDLRLAPRAAQDLSMALHELATNAAKHGALSAPGGTVALAWSTDPGTGALRLRWTETGGPRIAAPPARRGFGSRMLEATVRQLGGAAALDWDAAGLVCRIEVPLARVLARPGDKGGAPGHRGQGP
jgi:PAS domain S-box-containing protein